MTQKAPQDEIIASLRAVREELAAQHGYDVDRLYQSLKRREEASDRPFLEARPKRIKPVADPASWRKDLSMPANRAFNVLLGVAATGLGLTGVLALALTVFALSTGAWILSAVALPTAALAFGVLLFGLTRGR